MSRPPCFLLMILALFWKRAIQNSCVLMDIKNEQCYCCAYDFYRKNFWAESYFPFPLNECLIKTAAASQMKQLFVFPEGTCPGTGCDGSLEKPLDSLEKALDIANEISNKMKVINIEIIVFSTSGSIYFWGSDGIVFFRRSNLKLSIRPGFCGTFSGAKGCIGDSKNIKIILKTAKVKIFISSYISLQNIIFDARDLVLPIDDNCIKNKINETCCRDELINSIYNPTLNRCGILKRSIDAIDISAGGQNALFNLEVIHDQNEKIVPLLSLSSVSFINFYPFGEAGFNYDSVISLISNLEGKIYLSDVLIDNCSFHSGILSYVPLTYFGNNGFKLIPLIPNSAEDLGLTLNFVVLRNYNTRIQDTLGEVSLFDFKSYMGSIIIMNSEITNSFLQSGYFFSIQEAKLSLELLFQNMTVRESSVLTFIYSERRNSNFKIAFTNIYFIDNYNLIYIWASDSPILQIDKLIYIGELPSFAFAVIKSTSVQVMNSVFSKLYNLQGEQTNLFISISEYAISLSDQFADAAINREFVAKDIFNMFNTNVSDSSAKFMFLTCLSSLLEVKMLGMNFFNLTLINMTSELIFAPTEKNFTMTLTIFENIRLDHYLVHLQPCIRIYIDKSIFRTITNYDNHFLYFETRTILTKSLHIFSMNDLLFENITLRFDSNEVESKSRYVIFVEYRTMGDGGSFYLTNTRLKNIFFVKEFSENKLLFISCVYFIMKNVLIETTCNNTILHHRITTGYSTFEATDVTFLNEFYPFRAFINTEKEYILEAIVRNCSVRASIITAGSLITLNNIQTLRMTLNFFKASSIDGSLLYLRVESLSKFLMDQNKFEGIPELSSKTIGITFGSNTKMVQNANPNIGIINIILINLLNTAIVVSEKSELWVKNSKFFNIKAENGALLVVKSNCLVSLVNLEAENIQTQLDGGAFYMVSSNLLISKGFLRNCKAIAGQGGVLYALESIVVFENFDFYNAEALAGGLAFSEASNFYLSSVSVTNSLAQGYGGCFQTKFGVMQILDVIILNTTAHERGAFMISDGTIINIKNATISKSKAIDFGIIIIFGSSSETYSTFEKILFLRNQAKSVPTLVVYDHKLYLFDANFEENIAGEGGTIIEAYFFYSECVLILSKIEIKYNTVLGGGNLIALYNSKLNLSEGRLVDNDVAQYIYSYFQSEVVIYKASFFQSFKEVPVSGEPIYFILGKQSNFLSITYSSFSGGLRFQIMLCIVCTEVQIDDSNFTDSSTRIGGSIHLTSSMFIARNSIFERIIGKENSAIFVEDSALLVLEFSKFYNNRCSEKDCTAVIFIKNKKATLSGKIIFKSITVLGIENRAIYAENIQINISDSLFVGSLLVSSSALKILNPKNSIITGSSFANFSWFGAVTIESQSTSSGNTSVNSSTNIEYVKISLERTNFYNCSSVTAGGGLSIYGNLQLSITEGQFLNCSSNEDGGGLYYGCSNLLCSLKVLGETRFKKCTALKSGGGIKVASNNLTISNSSSLTENLALIGNDLASIPSKLYLSYMENDTQFTEFSTKGRKNRTYFEKPSTNMIIKHMGQPFELGLFVLDNFENLLFLVTNIVLRASISNIFKIKANASFDLNKFEVLLKNSLGKIEGGSCYLSQMSVLSEISDIIVEIKFQTEISGLLLEEFLNVRLVNCPKGNVFYINRCILCDVNFYSLDNDSFSNKKSECEPCPENAECLGGDQILPLPGYWRMNTETALIRKCINEDACPTGEGTFNGSLCGEGYTGNICFFCQEGYGKSSNKCTECFRNPMFWVIFIAGNFIFFGFILFTKFSILKKVNNKSIEEREAQLLLKLFVSHFSYLTIISLFDLNWKAQITELFLFMNNYFNSSPQSVFVLDCFFQASPEEKYKKTFIFVCLSPLIFTAASYLFSFVSEAFNSTVSHHLFRRSKHVRRLKIKEIFYQYFQDKENIKIELEGCLLIISLNTYPTIVMKLIDIFRCQELIESRKFLIKNPNIECWSSDHTFYIAFSLIFLIFWGLGIPLYFYYRSKKAFKYLKKLGIQINSITMTKYLSRGLSFSPTIKTKRNNLVYTTEFKIERGESQGYSDNPQNPADDRDEISRKTQNLNLFLISGYQEKFYYWEAVMFFKKALIIAASLLMTYLDKRSMTALIVALFFSFFIVNEKWAIYHSNRIKRYESLSLNVAIVTVSLGLFASDDKLNAFSKYMSLVLVVVFNLYFFLEWSRAFLSIKYNKIKASLSSMKSKKISKEVSS